MGQPCDFSRTGRWTRRPRLARPPKAGRKRMTDVVVPAEGVLLGRAQVPGFAASAGRHRAEGQLSISPARRRRRSATSASCPTRDYVAQASGTADRRSDRGPAASWGGEPSMIGCGFLSPIDLQAVKAAGVTFVVSLLERVIEEQARGDKAKADTLRKEILGLIGTDLSELVPGLRDRDEGQGDADRARGLEPVSRSRHRARPRDLHQMPADELRWPWR